MSTGKFLHPLARISSNIKSTKHLPEGAFSSSALRKAILCCSAFKWGGAER